MSEIKKGEVQKMVEEKETIKTNEKKRKVKTMVIETWVMVKEMVRMKLQMVKMKLQMIKMKQQIVKMMAIETV